MIIYINVVLNRSSEVYRNDAERAVKAVAKRELCFNYIFLDPPYKKQQLEKLIEIIFDFNLLNRDGSIICENGSDIDLPDRIKNFVRTKYEQYGTTSVSIYSHE